MKRLYALAVLALSVCFFACGDDDLSNNNCRCGANQVEFQFGNSRIYMPNAFTPNKDGINDLYIPFASSDVEMINSLVINAVDGELLYEYYNFPPNQIQFG